MKKTLNILFVLIIMTSCSSNIISEEKNNTTPNINKEEINIDSKNITKLSPAEVQKIKINDNLRESLARNISDGLSIYGSLQPLPLPDNYIKITDGKNVISYKGKAGKNVLTKIGFDLEAGKTKDTGEYLDYIVTSNRKYSLVEVCLYSKENALAFTDTKLLSFGKKTYLDKNDDYNEKIINYGNTLKKCD